MPLHDYRCPAGHTFSQYCKVADLSVPVICATHGARAERVFLRAPFGQVDIQAYQSPIDDRPITSRRERKEDLKRAGCIEWEPGIEQDLNRRRAEEERQFDSSIERTADEIITNWPVQKRERLAAEMDHGLDVEITRTAPVTT